MSYCRFSTDDFRCDVYLYATDRGYDLLVAGNRVPDDTPRITADLLTETEAYFAQEQAMHDFLKECKHAPIGGPHDNASFHPETAAECVEILEMLRGEGYRFPDDVLNELCDEMEESRCLTP